MNTVLDAIWRFGAFIQWQTCLLLSQYLAGKNLSLYDRISMIQMTESAAYLSSTPVEDIPPMVVEKLRRQSVIGIALFLLITILGMVNK